jgi:hypothetical protein
MGGSICLDSKLIVFLYTDFCENLACGDATRSRQGLPLKKPSMRGFFTVYGSLKDLNSERRTHERCGDRERMPHGDW